MMRVLVRGLGVLVLAAAAAGTAAAAESYRLVSAQVLAAPDRPAVLKLAATGPIAFEEVPDPTAPAGGSQITVRLYGVAPGSIAGEALAPFTLAVHTDRQDTVLTVRVEGDATLRVRASARTNEIEVAQTIR